MSAHSEDAPTKLKMHFVKKVSAGFKTSSYLFEIDIASLLLFFICSTPPETQTRPHRQYEQEE